MKLAFQRSDSTALGWFVRLFERGEYSHVELLFSDGVSFSCVANEGASAFGVRKRVTAYDDTWTLVDVDVTPIQEELARAFCEGSIGKPYDVISLLGYVFKGGKVFPHAYICSEWVQDVLHFLNLWLPHKGEFNSPSKLYQIVSKEKP